MIKESQSLYKMPYFNVATQTLEYVGKIQKDYQEIACVCNEIGCNADQEGFKYTFSYKATPTIEPVSYKLKGYSYQANLSYDDIGIDISSDVKTEIEKKINNIILSAPDGISNDIFSNLQNSFNNWKLTENIFWRTNSFLYKDEIYDELSYLSSFVPVLKINANIYTVNIQQSVVDWT